MCMHIFFLVLVIFVYMYNIMGSGQNLKNILKIKCVFLSDTVHSPDATVVGSMLTATGSL